MASYRVYRMPGLSAIVSFDNLAEAYAYCMAHRFDDADDRYMMFSYDDGIRMCYFSKCPRPYVTASGVRKYLDKPSNI